jgi:hypothetical protein
MAPANPSPKLRDYGLFQQTDSASCGACNAVANPMLCAPITIVAQLSFRCGLMAKPSIGPFHFEHGIRADLEVVAFATGPYDGAR